MVNLQIKISRFNSLPPFFGTKDTDIQCISNVTMIYACPLLILVKIVLTQGEVTALVLGAEHMPCMQEVWTQFLSELHWE